MRQHDVAFHALLRRRSIDEKWPRRLALFTVVALCVSVLYALFRKVEVVGGVGKEGNSASRRVGSRKIGLPGVEGNGVNMEDQFTDSAFAMRGAMYAAKIIDYVNGVAFGDVEKKMWIDAGLAVHQATKTKSLLTPQSLLAVGMMSEDRELLVASFKDTDFPSQDGCKIEFTKNPLPPDAGWYFLCNSITIRALLYEDFNETHLYLPWPVGYVRCLHCTTDELYLLKDTVAEVVECGKWAAHTTAIHGHTYCPLNMDGYLSNWTGDPRWADLHTGHIFNHAKLTRAVHDTFHATVQLVLTLFLTLAVLVGLALLSSKAAGVVSKKD